jgi:hypothetical protein
VGEGRSPAGENDREAEPQHSTVEEIRCDLRFPL